MSTNSIYLNKLVWFREAYKTTPWFRQYVTPKNMHHRLDAAANDKTAMIALCSDVWNYHKEEGILKDLIHVIYTQLRMIYETVNGTGMPDLTDECIADDSNRRFNVKLYNGWKSDVEIHINSVEYKLHVDILSEGSEFFRQIFSGKYNNNTDVEILAPDGSILSERLVKILIQHIYDIETELPERVDDLISLHAGAKYLALDKYAQLIMDKINGKLKKYDKDWSKEAISNIRIKDTHLRKSYVEYVVEYVNNPQSVYILAGVEDEDGPIENYFPHRYAWLWHMLVAMKELDDYKAHLCYEAEESRKKLAGIYVERDGTASRVRSNSLTIPISGLGYVTATGDNIDDVIAALEDL